MRVLILSLSVWTSVGFAATMENIVFKDEMLVGAQKYVLNGIGLRANKKSKDYVAALYVASKTSDPSALISGLQPKILEVVFLREMDRETLQSAWMEAFSRTCGSDCAAAKAHFKAFNDLMVDVQDNSRMKITFERESVIVDVKGPSKGQNAMLAGEAIRRALMAMFVGEKAPHPDLKKALLGETKT